MTRRIELSRTSLLREVYRSLLNTGRTYAAFREEDRQTALRLVNRGAIIDPMSGYGGLASFSAELGVESFGIEYNPPQYFWQLLSLPDRTGLHLAAIDNILRLRRCWPRPRQRAIVSDEFFPEAIRPVITSLFEVITRALADLPQSQATDVREVALSMLLPFSGRLACTSPADISTHTKQGGTCVLLGWQDDFVGYLAALRRRLEGIRERSKCFKQEVILGDARSVDLANRRFRSMFTSPPYPNHRDFSSILLPENTLIQDFADIHGLRTDFARESIIGSNFVKGSERAVPRSASVASFIAEASRVRRSKQAEYDDAVYYIPYFENYFAALESAYKNVAKYLDASFEGYVTVVNNTHRGVVVPVAKTVREIWGRLGFGSEIFRSIESFHLGTRNPRAKGIRARHTEYVVRIWR